MIGLKVIAIWLKMVACQPITFLRTAYRPLTDVQGQNSQLQTGSSQKGDKSNVISDLAILASKGAKICPQKNICV